MTKKWHLLVAAVAVVAAVPTAAFGAERVGLPPWMATMMGQTPPEMQRHMDSPEMQEMMARPEMRRMMDAASPASMEQMMRTPPMSKMMQGSSPDR